jgi:hypothetical protein
MLDDADSPSRLTIGVTGYQFPDAPELAMRCSWHMVGGEAHCREGSWAFRWQALTCDESPQVSAWLTDVADAVARQRELPGPLRFVEPNREFCAVAAGRGTVQVLVSFDVEFQPPWHRRRGAGDPFTLSFSMDEEPLRQAARQWDAERAHSPTCSQARASPQNSGTKRLCGGRSAALGCVHRGDMSSLR